MTTDSQIFPSSTQFFEFVNIFYCSVYNENALYRQQIYEFCKIPDGCGTKFINYSFEARQKKSMFDSQSEKVSNSTYKDFILKFKQDMLQIRWYK